MHVRNACPDMRMRLHPLQCKVPGARIVGTEASARTRQHTRVHAADQFSRHQTRLLPARNPCDCNPCDCLHAFKRRSWKLQSHGDSRSESSDVTRTRYRSNAVGCLTTKRAGTTMELARSHQAIGSDLSGVIPLLTAKVPPYSVRHRSGWGATALAGVQLRESKRIRAWWHHVVSIANLQPPVTTFICKAACQHPASPCYPPTTTLP
jgi:hypothetical protein